MGLTLKVGEDRYPFDMEHLTINEAKFVKRNAGLTVSRFWNGLMDDDPDAVQAAIYLAKTRNGDAVDFDDLESLDFSDIEFVYEPEPGDDTDDEDPTEVDEENPTSPDVNAGSAPGTSTSTKSAPSTSEDSPSTSTS